MRNEPFTLLRAALLALALLAAAPRAPLAAIVAAEGANNISVGTIARNAAAEPMLQINLDNSSGDPNAEVVGITITASGTGHDVNDLAAGATQLYWDKDGNGRLTTGGADPDTVLASGSFAADNGTLAFTGFVVPLPAGSEVNLLVLYTLGPTATAGKSFRARVASNPHISVRNAATLAPLSVTGAAVSGFTRTVGAGKLTIVRIAQDPDGAVAIPNRPRLPLINLNLIADDVENIVISSMDFLDVGTANAATGFLPGTVRLFNQANQPSGSSTPIASGSFPADGARVTLAPGTPLTIPRNSSAEVWVTADVVGLAGETIGNTFKIQVPSTTALSAAGGTSTDAPTVLGAGANGPQWDFNYNPLFFTKPDDFGAIFMPSTATKYPMFAFTVENDPEAKSEAVFITRFRFHADGSMNDFAAVSALELWKDRGTRGKYDPNDILLGTSTFSGDNGTVTFDFAGTPANLGVNNDETFLVTMDLNGSAVDGQTARLSLLTRDDMTAIGAVSTVNGSLIPSPFQGAIKTVGLPRAQLTLETNADKIPPLVAPNTAGFPLLGLKIKNLTDEDMRFSGLNLDFTGPANEAALMTTFELWYDENGNGVKDLASDIQIGVDGVLADNGGEGLLALVFPEAESHLIPRNQEQRFTLFGDITNAALGDGSEVFSIVADADADILAYGSGSNAPFSFTSVLPPLAAVRTIVNPAVTLGGYPNPANVLGCINASYGFHGLSFAAPSAEDLLIQKIRFRVDGTLNDPLFIVGATVWHDKNKNMLIDTSEGPLAFGIHDQPSPISVDNGSGEVDMTSSPGLAAKNKTTDLTLALHFSAPDPATAQAQRDKTITVIQDGPFVLEGVGARSGRPILVTNAPEQDQGRTMTFSVGDLTVSQDTVPRISAPPNGSNIETLALLLKTDIIEDVRIDSLQLTPLGTLNEATHIKPGGVKIFIDDNKNGKVDNDDYLYAAVDPPLADNGPIVFTAPNYLYSNTVYSFPPGGHPYDQFLLALDLTPTAPEGATIQFSLAAANHLAATGACSLFPYIEGAELVYSPALPPITGPVIVVERGAIDLKTDQSFANAADNNPEVVMAPQATAYEVLRIDAKATSSESVDLRGITVRSVGAANELADIAPAGVALYRNSVAAGNLITSGTFNMNDGAAVLGNFRQQIVLTDDTTVDLRLAFTGSGAGVIGNDFNISLAGLELNALGLSSNLPITTIVPADPYVGIPIRLGAGKLYVRATDDDGFVLPIPGAEPPRLQRLRFTASRTEGIRIEDLTIRAAGTADETAVLDSAAIIMNSRQGSNPPVLIGSAPFEPGDNGLAALRNLNIDIAAGANTATKFSLDAEMVPGAAVLGTTLRMDLESTATMRAVGALTGQDVAFVFEDFAGGDNLAPATLATGRNVTLSTGFIELRKGNKNPANHIVLGTDQMKTMLQARIDVEADLEAVTISDAYVCALGNADDAAAISQLYLFRDVDGDGVATAADTLLGTSTFPSDNGTAHFSGLSATYAEGVTVFWVVAADFTGAALQGQTLQVSLSCPPAIAGTGQLTTAPIGVLVKDPFPVGALLTIGEPTPTPIPTPPNRAGRAWQLYD